MCCLCTLFCLFSVLALNQVLCYISRFNRLLHLEPAGDSLCEEPVVCGNWCCTTLTLISSFLLPHPINCGAFGVEKRAIIAYTRSLNSVELKHVYSAIFPLCHMFRNGVVHSNTTHSIRCNAINEAHALICCCQNFFKSILSNR